MARRTSLLALAAATLLLSACGEEKVATYRVPKEKDQDMPAGAPSDAAAPAGHNRDFSLQPPGHRAAGIASPGRAPLMS